MTVEIVQNVGLVRMDSHVIVMIVTILQFTTHSQKNVSTFSVQMITVKKSLRL